MIYGPISFEVPRALRDRLVHSVPDGIEVLLNQSLAVTTWTWVEGVGLVHRLTAISDADREKGALHS